MKPIKLTDTHKLMVLEKGEYLEGKYLYVRDEIGSEYIGNYILASEVTESQAYKLGMKDIFPTHELWHRIREALKSEGMEIREGDRPESKNYSYCNADGELYNIVGSLYEDDVKTHDAATPLDRIIVTI